jgi:hypothetical protein
VVDFDKLQVGLSNVGLFNNGAFSAGLKTTKGPGLLLNALLAHDIYKNVFDLPFGSIDDVEVGNSSMQYHYDTLWRFRMPRSPPHGRSQRSKNNEKEVHLWRSQTLRLLTLDSENASQARKICCIGETRI